jgi:hypothetical protein
MTSDFENVPKRRRTDHVLPKADLSNPALHTAKELRRMLRILIGLTVVLYVIMFGIATYTYFQGQRNTKALCTIRDNAQNRVAQAQQFLQDHPNGIAGLTPDDLQRSINTSQATVKALEDVDCPPPPTP